MTAHVSATSGQYFSQTVHIQDGMDQAVASVHTYPPNTIHKPFAFFRMF